MSSHFELLAPAGSFEILKEVLNAGADAVYLGGQMFGARAYADNFDTEELIAAINYAHLRGKKVYLTVNTLLKNEELGLLHDYLKPLYLCGLDAVLVQDFGVLRYIREHFPALPVHASTQMTITGIEGVKLLQKYGVTRVVMARELSIPEMRCIHEQTGMELEAFIHGALCYSYSGQCLFSSMLGGRSGNRGRCAQPCRLPYTVLDGNKKIIAMESYILSLKDLCGISHLEGLKEAGVYSLKIEGRMKSKAYAAGVVSVYRRYVDMLDAGDGEFEAAGAPDAVKREPVPASYVVSAEDEMFLQRLGNRCGFTDTYLMRHNGKEMVTCTKPSFCSDIDVFPVEERYVPIAASARFIKGEPSSLTLMHAAEAVTVTVYGQMLEEAKSKPVTETDIRERLSKTRDTAFCFEPLDIGLSDRCFIPNGAVNRLKREAVLALEEKILGKYRRIMESGERMPEDLTGKAQSARKDGGLEKAKKTDAGAVRRFIFSTENREHLDVGMSQSWADDIYLDSGLYTGENFAKTLADDVESCHKRGKRVFLILPYIFRRKTADFYEKQVAFLKSCGLDGFVAKNCEGLWFIKEHFNDKELVADYSLYAYNDEAVSFLREFGVKKDTVPLELNRAEINGRDNRTSQMLLYGYYPLMTTAACVHKNTKECDKKPGICYLKDRYHKTFAVRNCCSECVNIIYNSVPTMLFSYYKELCEAGITDFRFHFTIESRAEAAKLCLEIDRMIKEGGMCKPQDTGAAYTNGHYKRGVE